MRKSNENYPWFLLDPIHQLRTQYVTNSKMECIWCEYNVYSYINRTLSIKWQINPMQQHHHIQHFVCNGCRWVLWDNLDKYSIRQLCDSVKSQKISSRDSSVNGHSDPLEPIKRIATSCVSLTTSMRRCSRSQDHQIETNIKYLHRFDSSIFSPIIYHINPLLLV